MNKKLKTGLIVALAGAGLWGAAYLADLPVTPQRIKEKPYSTEVIKLPMTEGNIDNPQSAYEKSLARERITLYAQDGIAFSGRGSTDIVLEKKNDEQKWHVAFMHPDRHDPNSIGYQMFNCDLQEIVENVEFDIVRKNQDGTKEVIGKTPKGAASIPIYRHHLDEIEVLAEKVFGLDIDLDPSYEV